MNNENKTNEITDIDAKPVEEGSVYVLDEEKSNYNKIYFERQMDLAEKNLILKKYKDAIKIYSKLTRKFKDYRPWLKMFDIAVIKNVSIDKKCYQKYYNRALLCCKTDEQSKIVNEKYDSIFNGQKQYELALDCQKKCDYKKAVYWLKKASNQLHLLSIIELGKCYYNGRGVIKSVNKARYWWGVGTDAGEIECLYHLGNSYIKNPPYNIDKAIYYYQIGADKGNANCQYELGLCYRSGFRGKKNLTKSLFWLDKAANNGQGDAAQLLGNLYFTGSEITKDTVKGLAYFEKGAKSNNINSLLFLGHYYQNDKEKSTKYIKQALALGSAEALNMMKTLGIK